MIYITAPIFSESGYGHKARGIVTPIVNHYGSSNVYVESYPWGNTPETGLTIINNFSLVQHMRNQERMKDKPDLHIHIGVPTMMKSIGKYNICFTSGVETDKVSIEWLIRMNHPNIDEFVVPSNFVKTVFENTSYTSNVKSSSLYSTLKLFKKVTVIPEEYDPSMLDPYQVDNDGDMSIIMDSLGDSRYFLSCGQIGNTKVQDVFSGRKNEAQLIISFLKTFTKKDNVILLLKTNPITYSELMYYEVAKFLRRCKKHANIPLDDDNLPQIKLIKGHLTPQQLFYLMSNERNIANVSFTHGEGFGRFLLESSLSNRPLIVSKNGAHRDFTDASFAYYIDGVYKQIPKEAVMRDILIPTSKWFVVDENQASQTLRKVYNNPKVRNNSQKIIENLKRKHHPDEVGNMIIKHIEPFVKTNIVTNIQL
jgi:hypothetical protein